MQTRDDVRVLNIHFIYVLRWRLQKKLVCLWSQQISILQRNWQNCQFLWQGKSIDLFFIRDKWQPTKFCDRNTCLKETLIWASNRVLAGMDKMPLHNNSWTDWKWHNPKMLKWTQLITIIIYLYLGDVQYIRSLCLS